MKQCSFLIAIMIIALMATGTRASAQKIPAKQEEQRDGHLRKGFQHFMDREDEEALKEYKLALQIDSACTNAWQNIGLHYAKADSIAKALDITNNALKHCREDLQDLYRLKANCLAGLERYNEALPWYYKALRIEPGNMNAVYNLGYSYYSTQKWDSALYYLLRYENDGNDSEDKLSDVLFYIGTSYYSKGNAEASLPYFDRAIALERFSNYYYNKAQALNSLNRNEEALSVLEDGIHHNPDSATLYHKSYQVHRDLKQWDASRKALLKAASLDKNDPDILLDLGTLYEKENNITQALQCFYRCLSYPKHKAGAAGNIANLYSNNEQMRDSALYYYRQTLVLAPGEAKNYYNFGNYYKKIKEPRKAIAMYEQAIKTDPALSQSYNNIAAIYMEQEEYTKAKPYVRHALILEPEDYILQVKMAKIYQYLKDCDSAVIYANKAIQLAEEGYNKDEPLHVRAICRQMSGDCKNAIYDYMDMLSYLSEQERKQNPSLLSNLAYCYLEEGELDLAHKYFEEAIRANPETDQLLGLSIVQFRQGDTTASKISLKKAIAAEPLLVKGYKGIIEMESQGYFYSQKNKEWLRKILKAE